MGGCFSKNSTTAALPPNPLQVEIKSEVDTKNEQPVFKKEIFVIKHRISHEIDRHNDQNPSATAGDGGGGKVRTPSRTKEELDAILIQCGRLSRSNSTGAQNPRRKRRCSRSKRSFDFDLNNDGDADVDEDDGGVNHHPRHRHRQQEVRVSSPCSRRSSRERDPQLERCTSGRRISISPSRRSESPFRNLNTAVASSNRPAKMVPVPATDKSNNVSVEHSVKRIHVKRNVGAASPRATSPAKTNLGVFKDNPLQDQQMEPHHFPCTRKSLAEIGNNTARSSQPANTKTALSPSIENLIHQQNITTTRKLSRDLDMNTKTKPDRSPPSYATLLLEDIHNFHRKNTNATTSPPTFSLPDCVTKACSIMEAVADLNSNTSSLFSEDRWRNPTPVKREITQQQETSLADRELEVRELRDYPQTGIGRGGRRNTVFSS